MNIFRQLLEELGHGREVVLATVLSADTELYEGQQLLYDAAGNSLSGSFAASIGRSGVGIKRIETEYGRVEMMIEPYSPPPTVVIFGSGHIAECLAALAKMLLFQVVIVDDRAEYANCNNFPEVDHIYCGPYNEMASQIPFHKHHYCLIVTRGHRTDAVCLAGLLTKSIPYIGLVGSRRKVQFICKLLKEQKMYSENPSNFFAPVGLDFHSETPQEIAFSIMAEIQKIRSGGTARSISQLGDSINVHPYADRRIRLDIEFIEVMAKAIEEKQSFASILIVETSGHVPRGVGSRAIVWEDGRIFRTVGGGRRESELIRMALDCLSTGKIMIKHIPFSGEYDGFEPVCGGSCTVFIQPYIGF